MSYGAIPSFQAAANAALKSATETNQSRTTSDGYKVLYSFKGGTNGSEPVYGLVNVDGSLYGTTRYSGDRKCCDGGTFFSITLSGKETPIYRFGGVNGVGPYSGLTYRGKELYGETYAGGTASHTCSYGCGTVFEISTKGQEHVLHTFPNLKDPLGGLLYRKGRLYGVASGGGRYNYGGVFAVDLSGKTTVLHNFGANDHDGKFPSAYLVNVNGTFYGTTDEGGTEGGCYQYYDVGCGTVFSITPSGSEKVLYRFKGGGDGANPQEGLIDVNGLLYGTTYFGGTLGYGCPYGCGTVYNFDPSLRKEHVIYRFQGDNDGILPVSGLVKFRGALYGTTAIGGTGGCNAIYKGCGTIYRVTTAGSETVLHSFQGYPADGDRPWAASLLVVNNSLYGTTAMGGSHCPNELNKGCGVIFVLTP